MVEGRYLGHHTRTGACIPITSEGVIHASGIRRLPEDQKWIKEGWSDLKGLPWDTNPRKKAEKKPGDPDEAEEESKPIAVGEEAQPLQLPVVPEAQAKEKETRGFYVLKSDIDKYQARNSCPGCAMVTMTGKTHAVDGSVIPHNDTCRERILKLVMEDTDRSDRALRYQRRARMAEVTRAKRDRPEENAAEAAGDSKKRVRATPKTRATKRTADESAKTDEEKKPDEDDDLRVVGQTGGSSGSGVQTKKVHIEDLVDTVSRPESGQGQAESSADPSAAAGSGQVQATWKSKRRPELPRRKEAQRAKIQRT